MKFLVLLLLSITTFAQSPKAIERCRFLLTKLNADSALTAALSKQIRKDFDFKNGKGFSVADLSLYLPTDLSEDLFKELPGYSTLQISGSRYDSKQLRRPLDPLIDKSFKPFLTWLTKVIQAGLPKGELFVQESAELRVISDPKAIAHLRGERYHHDGGEITVIVSLLGPGTVYSPFNQRYFERFTDEVNDSNRGDIFELNRGQMLVFSGSELHSQTDAQPNFQPLIHASPTTNQARLLLVVRYGTN